MDTFLTGSKYDAQIVQQIAAIKKIRKISMKDFEYAEL